MNSSDLTILKGTHSARWQSRFTSEAKLQEFVLPKRLEQFATAVSSNPNFGCEISPLYTQIYWNSPFISLPYFGKTETLITTSLTIFIDGHVLASHDFRDCPRDWTLAGCMVSCVID